MRSCQLFRLRLPYSNLFVYPRSIGNSKYYDFYLICTAFCILLCTYLKLHHFIEDRCVYLLNPRPVRGGVDATPHEFFWAGRHTVWRIVLKFSIAYGASFAQLLAKKIWSGQVRSRSYDVIRGTTFARFQRNREQTQLGVVRLTWMGIVDEIGVNTWLDVTLDIAPDEGQGQLRSPEVTDLGWTHNDK